MKPDSIGILTKELKSGISPCKNHKALSSVSQSTKKAKSSKVSKINGNFLTRHMPISPENKPNFTNNNFSLNPLKETVTGCPLSNNLKQTRNLFAMTGIKNTLKELLNSHLWEALQKQAKMKVRWLSLRHTTRLGSSLKRSQMIGSWLWTLLKMTISFMLLWPGNLCLRTIIWMNWCKGTKEFWNWRNKFTSKNCNFWQSEKRKINSKSKKIK